MTNEHFTCANCEKNFPVRDNEGFFSNYSMNAKKEKFCLPCSEYLELESLKKDGQGILYLCQDEKGMKYLQTFAGKNHFYVTYYRKSKGWGFGGSYNIETFCFTGPDKKTWFGKVMGDMQLARVKRYKKQ